MFEALAAESPDRITLWLARHEGDLVAATIAIRVGAHAWYSYGASSTEKRDVRGSNAIQWAMIRDALAAGADVYDLRGITDTLDADDPHIGLIQFKVGTGGEAVEYAGEWDLPLNRVLYKAFDTLHDRRLGQLMALTLTVDGERWRTHLRAVADATPGLVPVAKGNGYGFTHRPAGAQGGVARRRHPRGRHLRGAARGRAAASPATCWCSTPWRPFVADLDPALADRVIHTVSRPADLAALLAPPARAPGFVLERMTSMRRHGLSARELWDEGLAARSRAAGSRASRCTCRWRTAATWPR